ncbi:MAG: Maf family protein [Hyphomicrobiales bacterium]|nr:Maf family protein [Hyphomicrobiales bacterium]
MTPLWKLDQPILLASTSPTRLQLLQSAAIPVEVRSPDVDERAVEAELQRQNLSPDAIALELATAKGAQVSRQLSDRLVVAADQTLALGARQYHKPKNIDDGREQLLSLSGKTHALHSAVVCFRGGERLFAHVETARLTMRPFGPAFLEAYMSVAGDTVLRSVGGYQLEGFGVHLFERIEGDHSTILGLPLMPLLAYLRSAGAVEA